MYLERRTDQQGQVIATTVELEPSSSDGKRWPLHAQLVLEQMDLCLFTEFAGRQSPDKAKTEGLRLYYYGDVSNVNALELQAKLTKWLDDLQRFAMLEGIHQELQRRESKPKAKP